MATAIGIRSHWREIMGVFLKLGAMSYGGPAIMGMMQAEIQEKRGWLPKENFVEGLALVNMLPGAGATQLGIFLGFTRAGWWGGLLAGLCFVLPAFVIMLVLTWTYYRYGALPLMRGVFYGLTPVVVGIFAVAVQRLGRAAIKDAKQIGLALASALVLYFTTTGIVPVLLMAGALGASVDPSAAGVWDIGAFFFKVGAFTFGGGAIHAGVYARSSGEPTALVNAAAISRWPRLEPINPWPDLDGGRICGLSKSVIWRRTGGCNCDFLAFVPADVGHLAHVRTH